MCSPSGIRDNEAVTIRITALCAPQPGTAHFTLRHCICMQPWLCPARVDITLHPPQTWVTNRHRKYLAIHEFSLITKNSDVCGIDWSPIFILFCLWGYINVPMLHPILNEYPPTPSISCLSRTREKEGKHSASFLLKTHLWVDMKSMALLERGWSQSPGEGEVIASVKTKISSWLPPTKTRPNITAADTDSGHQPASRRDAIQQKLYKWLTRNFFSPRVIDNQNNWLLFVIIYPAGSLHHPHNGVVIHFFLNLLDNAPALEGPHPSLIDSTNCKLSTVLGIESDMSTLICTHNQYRELCSYHLSNFPVGYRNCLRNQLLRQLFTIWSGVWEEGDNCNDANRIQK